MVILKKEAFLRRTLSSIFSKEAFLQGFSDPGSIPLLFYCLKTLHTPDPIYGKNVFNSLNRVARNAALFKSLAHEMKRIDDFLDRKSAEDIIMMGPAESGFKPCPFLRSNENIFGAFDNLVLEMDKRQIMPASEGYYFSNIFALLVIEQAEASCDFACDKFLVAREKLSETNRKLAVVQACLILHFFSYCPSISSSIQDGSFNVEKMEELFPDYALMAHLLDLRDDLLDFFIDGKEEVLGGGQVRAYSPNLVLLQLHRNQDLYEGGAIKPDLYRFWYQSAQAGSGLPLYKAPDRIQQAIKDLTVYYYNECNKLHSASSRAFMKLLWDSALDKKTNIKVFDKSSETPVLEIS